MKWRCKLLLLSLFFTLTLTACGTGASQGEAVTAPNVTETVPQVSGPALQEVSVSSEIRELEPGLSVVEFTGDDGFEDFLAAGGASSDAEVAAFLTDRLTAKFDWLGGIFGCSTIAAESPEGSRLFGRNFDWNTCNALIVLSHPDSGYSSISTVNLDFIGSASGLAGAAMKLGSVRTQAARYAPLDGMNDQGLAVSVNMVGDSAAFPLHLYDNPTAEAISYHVGTSPWQLPIYHYDDFENWEVMQYYDIPSRYEIPSSPESVTAETAGAVYYSEPNRIILFYGDAQVPAEYTPVGWFDFTDAFYSAVVNNPVLEGWGNKLIHISAFG